LKSNRVYLLHIAECIRRIEHIASSGRNAFESSYVLQDAVLRNFQVLAESTQRLSADLKNAWPEVEWQKISAFRNVLVHDYLGIDLDQIWQIMQADIPTLAGSIAAIIDSTHVDET
jgi:uncharacterized protein with HEPN domain